MFSLIFARALCTYESKSKKETKYKNWIHWTINVERNLHFEYFFYEVKHV
jgi:hypothetical protein